MKLDMDKVEVIRSIPGPQTKREIQEFIGTVGYYRSFIPRFSRIIESRT